MNRERHPDVPVGLDTSPDMHTVIVVCAQCQLPTDRGAALYPGDEWGGPLPACSRCGCVLDGLDEVSS